MRCRWHGGRKGSARKSRRRKCAPTSCHAALPPHAPGSDGRPPGSPFPPLGPHSARRTCTQPPRSAGETAVRSSVRLGEDREARPPRAQRHGPGGLRSSPGHVRDEPWYPASAKWRSRARLCSAYTSSWLSLPGTEKVKGQVDFRGLSSKFLLPFTFT